MFERFLLTLYCSFFLSPTAICKVPCQNGGTCAKPNQCNCPSGYKTTTCGTRKHNFYYFWKYFFHYVLQVLNILKGLITSCMYKPITCFVSFIAAVCQRVCQNGGSCIAPNKCKCQPGYSGQWCQICKFKQWSSRRRYLLLAAHFAKIVYYSILQKLNVNFVFFSNLQARLP